MINKIINIGCLGQGLMFSKWLGYHINGPVDNMQGYNFKSILNIFDGSLFDALLNDHIDFYHVREYQNCQESDDDNYLRYYCTNNNVEWNYNNYSFPTIKGHYNWRTIHNNFELAKRKEQLKERINNFNFFNENIDDNSIYLYTIADDDHHISEEDFNFTINNLPSYVVERMLVITSLRNEIPYLFLNYFKCLTFNYDILNKYNINNKWIL